MALQKTSTVLEDWQLDLLDEIAKKQGPLYGASRAFLIRHAINHTYKEAFGDLIEEESEGKITK